MALHQSVLKRNDFDHSLHGMFGERVLLGHLSLGRLLETGGGPGLPAWEDRLGSGERSGVRATRGKALRDRRGPGGSGCSA